MPGSAAFYRPDGGGGDLRRPRYAQLYPCLWAFVAVMAITGFLLDSPENILRGLWNIIMIEDALITDYLLVAGPGGALVNSALVTAITLIILRLAGDVPNGMTLVEVGLMSGFSLFGKNIVNIWPILIGSWLYAKVRREHWGTYAGIGLMATALAPVVSYIAIDNGFGNLYWGILVGLLIGFVTPPWPPTPTASRTA